MKRAVAARSPLFGCLVAVVFMIYTSFLGGCDSKATVYLLSNRVDDYGQDRLLYLDTMDDTESEIVNLRGSRQMSPKRNHVFTSFKKTKRGAGNQVVCPPGIDERECYYDLMAVWVRMLMKEKN